MSPSESHVTILNVDDNEGGRYALTRLLERHHYVVKEARTGREALAMAEQEQPDLVLLDVNLPDMNGLDVCRILKNSPSTSRIPVLHVTASYLSPDDMARGLESGADSYLTEPVEPAVLMATIRSVLRARRAEDSAHDLLREWQATFDSISDGVAVLDASGVIRRCNQAFATMAGSSLHDLVGIPGTSVFGELQNKHPLHRALETGTRQSLEVDYDSKRLLITVDPIFNHNRVPSGAVEIIRDLTERRQLEEQFRESQKFETIGTLAAGVAHDFNNLLTSIMGNASLMWSDVPPESPHREKLDDIVSASQRAADLTKQLLAYSGKGRHYIQRVELSALVEQVRHLVESAVPKKVTLEFRLDRRLPVVDADPSQIQQVLMNLVSNAAEAIGDENGRIVVCTGREGDGVFLEVKDSGCGMEEEVRLRMFDPFFTTKFTGRGLGLAAVAGIARGHKATIRVTSAPGAGSELRLIFPTSEQPVAAVPASKSPHDLTGSGTVLVVDDEDMVRRIARAALEARGYRVVMANDGLDAIRAAQEHPETQLILLDLTMPVMGGEEAIASLMDACPDAKVIVSTGYDHRDALKRFKSQKVAGFLQKPYTSRQLAEKVKSVLAGRGVPN